ncbi:hypothetical protein FWH13_01205 [Candidatus Saccharibacteria bacterium]|nr:hypothetical protein [Candidatus Saccharibacteria bacterium]
MTKISKAIAALSVVAGLGVAAMPLAAYADIPVTVEVPEAIEIVDPTDPTTFAEISPAALNFVFDGTTIGSTLTQPLTITGSTTAANGFTVSMSTATDNNALVNTVSSVNTIPATAGGASLSANTWGYRTTGNYMPVPGLSTPVGVFVTGAAGEATETLTFGVNVDSTLQSGTYANTVVFTIAHNL